MKGDFHSLLRRQLARYFPDGKPSGPGCDKFLAAVNEAYREFDSDREMLERSLDMSSRELLSANDALRNANQSLEAVFEVSESSHFWIGEDGVIQQVRSNGSTSFLFPAGDLVGRRIDEIVDPSVAARFESCLWALRRTAEPITFDYTLHLDERAQRFEAHAKMLGNEQALVVIRNVSYQRFAEEQQVKLLAEHTRAVLWTVDLRVQSFVYVSPTYDQIWGRSRSELRRFEDLLETIHPSDRGRVANQWMSRELEPADVEYRIMRPDGSVRWIRERSVAMVDDAGYAARRTGVAADVTASKVAQDMAARNTALVQTVARQDAQITAVEGELEASREQLRQAQKMEAVGRLAGGVAHDFNNLLVVILSYSSLLIDETEPAEEAYEDLVQIKSAAERAAALTQQLLAFSRRQVLHPEVIDLNEIVGGLEKLLERLIGEDVHLTTLLDDRLARTKVDKGQVEQIVMNLAVNARDAMPQGGTLRLQTLMTTHGGEPWVTLTVADNGCGMDEETQAKIFEPFFTTKSEGKGTGLGLSTVFGIVKQSGGHIDVKSTPGQGTQFVIRFPRAKQVSMRNRRSTLIPTTVHHRERVLVVEDEDMVRGLVKRVLEAKGYRVTCARSGSEALRLLQGANPDENPVELLVTDVVLPGMHGRELVERLSERWPELPVLYMTGYTDDSVLRYGVEAGSADLIHKPFTPRQLLARVRRSLDIESRESA